MDLRVFFAHFLQENELVRANLINDATFDSIEALINYKMKEIEALDRESEVLGKLTMTEVELIRNLVDIQAEDHLHYTAYDVSSYPVLIDCQYILEAGGGNGVIHHDIIGTLHAALKVRGVLPAHPMYIHKDEPLDPEEIRGLENIYRGPIYWLYDNLTWRTLKTMLKRLNVEPDSHQKEDYLRHITSVVTHPKYLEAILVQLGPEEYDIIRENVEKGFNVYETSSRWETAKEIGLLVKVHADHYVMHEDVRRAVAAVDFSTVTDRRRRSDGGETRRRSGGDYNAYIMNFEIRGLDFLIAREVVVPAGINFFELNLIIQKAMGWQRKHNSVFLTKSMAIHETLGQLREAEDDGRAKMVASYTQIDALFDRINPIDYHYGDEYSVSVSLEDTTHLHRPIPLIRSHDGPVPIENIGGAEQLPRVIAILEDRNHPEHVRTLEKSRSTNYRERYPITAINNQLEKLFGKSHPITEFNM